MPLPSPTVEFVTVSDQRKSKRFELQLPMEILRTGVETRSEAAETRNLSSGNVLVASAIPMQIGDMVEYRITLPGTGEPVVLHCKGKVLRRDGASPGPESDFAISLERYEFVRPNHK
jgi:hypothetical protein